MKIFFLFILCLSIRFRWLDSQLITELLQNAKDKIKQNRITKIERKLPQAKNPELINDDFE